MTKKAVWLAVNLVWHVRLKIFKMFFFIGGALGNILKPAAALIHT